MNARDAFLANELRGLARAFQRIAEKPNVSEVLQDSPRVAEAGHLLRTAYSRGLVPELYKLSELVAYIESSTDQSEIAARDEVLFQLFCGLRGFVESESERKAPYCPESLNYVFRLTGISDTEPAQLNWEDVSEWEVDQFSVVCNWLADMIEQRSQSETLGRVAVEPTCSENSQATSGDCEISTGPYRPGNYDRDQWMLEQWNDGKTLAWIRSNIPAKWEPVDDDTTVSAATHRHAQRFNLSRREGKKGRPRKKKN